MKDHCEAQAFLAEEAVKASNRTTHAVRALAKFVLYQSFYALMVVFLMVAAMVPVASLKEPLWGLVVFASLLAFIGLAHSLGAAGRELKASEITWSGLPQHLRPRVSRDERASQEHGEKPQEPGAPADASGTTAQVERSRYERLYGIEGD